MHTPGLCQPRPVLLYKSGVHGGVNHTCWHDSKAPNDNANMFTKPVKDFDPVLSLNVLKDLFFYPDFEISC